MRRPAFVTSVPPVEGFIRRASNHPIITTKAGTWVRDPRFENGAHTCASFAAKREEEERYPQYYYAIFGLLSTDTGLYVLEWADE